MQSEGIESFNLHDDDEEFQRYVQRDPYVVQLRIDLLKKWSERKFFYMRLFYVFSKIESKITSPTMR